jgi:hypothetical protein
MSETGIVVMHGPVARPLEYRRPRNHVSRGKRCATCKGNRGVGKFEDYAGFCRECLDRSRIVAGDDIGGES